MPPVTPELSQDVGKAFPAHPFPSRVLRVVSPGSWFPQIPTPAALTWLGPVWVPPHQHLRVIATLFPPDWGLFYRIKSLSLS